jgi:hypothetical protein
MERNANREAPNNVVYSSPYPLDPDLNNNNVMHRSTGPDRPRGPYEFEVPRTFR